MISFKNVVILFAGFILIAECQRINLQDTRSLLQSSEELQDASYDFRWQVSDEDTHYDLQEARTGDDTTGSYTVQLPDGRLQTVTYFVNGNSGYIARVKYSSVESIHSDESDEFVPRRRFRSF